MKSIITGLLLTLLIPATALASSLDVDTGSYLNPAPTVVWWGAAVYLNNQGEPGTGVALGASVGLWSGTISMGERSGTVYSGTWSAEAQFESPGGECYTTSVAAQTFDQYNQKYGAAVCVPVQNPYRNPPPVIIADDGQCGDPCTSPIVLDFQSGAYRLSSAAEGVLFDIDADGRLDRVAWPRSPDSVAFLYLDRNGNGIPDDGTELFGNHTLRADGVTASNGFDALISYDANDDGRITASDTVWPQLRLWFDRNRDGIAQGDEAATLASRSVTTLGTAAVWNRRRDAHGNVLLWKALFERDGTAHPFYDAYLTTAQFP